MPVKNILDDGEATVTKEISQLHDMNKFTLVDGSYFRKEESKGAIISVMFLTENDTAESRAEHAQMAMVSVENLINMMQHSQQLQMKVLITSDIDAHKRYEVVTIDIISALLTCGFRSSYHNGTDRKSRFFNVSCVSKIIQEVHYNQQERQTRYICENSEGPIRTAAKCTNILPQIGKGFTEIWT